MIHVILYVHTHTSTVFFLLMFSVYLLQDNVKVMYVTLVPLFNFGVIN